MGGEAGKGGTPREILISKSEWARLWDIAFPPKANKEEDDSKEE